MKKHSHNDKPDNERPCAQDPELDAPQIIYGPPPAFSPSDNMPEDIYGPPSAFGLFEEDPIEGS